MPKQIQKMWTDNEEATLIKYLKEGYRVDYIASKLGRSISSVRNKFSIIQHKYPGVTQRKF